MSTVDGQNIVHVSEINWQPRQSVSSNRGLFDHDKFNPFHQMLTSFVYRVRCSGAFDWKSKYRTCGARGVTERIGGRRRAQMLRNVARQSGGHHPGRWVYVQGMADRELRSLQDPNGLAGKDPRQRYHHACPCEDVGFTTRLPRLKVPDLSMPDMIEFLVGLREVMLVVVHWRSILVT